ncbi:MAG TPA: acid--CoA ligase [Micromonosporaceae bacterium]|nr:acid--CoA ligase [Micromonosporaceae bacterium]HCU48879.1 acid--CoA ligase [Micromonosporaceae bacterium]
MTDTFGAHLDRLAAAAPDRPAITCEGVVVTREQLRRKTNRLAHAYAKHGVGHDDFVTIALPNGIEFLESTIAVWKLGATPQPVSARLPAGELQEIVQLAKPALVVGTKIDGWPWLPAGFEPETPDDPLAAPAASCWKAPTSGGSTGRPKLIVATQPAEADLITPFAGLLGISGDSTMLTTGPLHHNGPFMTSAAGLLAGAHVVVMPKFDAETALLLIDRQRADWMYAVPTMMHRIWRLPPPTRDRYSVNSLRVVMHMAAPCPGWLKEAWIDWLGAGRVHELYAGTEAQAITVIRGDEWLRHRGSVGRPVLGEIQVLNEAGEQAKLGEVGKIWMRRGENVAPPYRYLGATATSRPGGWETLGDLGYLDSDGYLYLTDRETDMILVGGSNVYPAEIEAAIDSHPAVLSSCVIGLPDPDLGNTPHALVQLATDVPDAELLEHLAKRLGGYKLPRSFERVDHPLRDDGGKVRRSALRAERLPPQ